MWLSFLLFGLFTLLSVAGAWWVAAHLRGRRAGFLAAALTALFFGALFCGLLALIRHGGLL
jgi:uncharacterized membrane protein YvlD (DUF360 family)